MGFWHTGYAEFHEPSGLEGYIYSPPPPVRYVCEHCTASFAELEELRRHAGRYHHLPRLEEDDADRFALLAELLNYAVQFDLRRR